MGQRVIKRLIPGVEPDLRVSGGADDGNQGCDQVDQKVDGAVMAVMLNLIDVLS